MRVMYLVCALIAVITFQDNVYANGDSSTAELSWVFLRTELEEEALGVIAKYEPLLESERFFSGEGFGFLGPSIDVQTGGQDSFDRLIAKMNGFYVGPVPSDELGEPDYGERLMVFPFSAGVETERNLDSASFLIEAGWTPIGRAEPGKDVRFGLNQQRRIGVFLQAGYKFDTSGSNMQDESTPDSMTGGNVNQSSEEIQDILARVKFDMTYGFDFGDEISLVPSVSAWYDLANSDTYYQASILFRFDFADKFSWDTRIEKGSGPPLFNEGDQFSTGLTLKY